MKTQNVLLSKNEYDKVKEFSIKRDVSISEIFRVILDQKNKSIKPRNIKSILNDAKENGKVNNISTMIRITEEHREAIKDYAIKYKVSYSEVLRCLLNDANLDKLKLKTKGQRILETKNKTKK